MTLILILLSSIIGFVVAWHIWRKKVKKEKLVCVIGDDCDKVVHSKYSSIFFGVPNEIGGMLYYLTVVVGVVALLFGVTVIGTISLSLLLVIIGAFSAIFSMILIYIQAAVIKEWCEWCLASVGMSILIFVLEMAGNMHIS